MIKYYTFEFDNEFYGNETNLKLMNIKIKKIKIVIKVKN